jgi:hypothetical protein
MGSGGVNTTDGAVLCGLAWLDEMELHPTGVGPRTVTFRVVYYVK